MKKSPKSYLSRGIENAKKQVQILHHGTTKNSVNRNGPKIGKGRVAICLIAALVLTAGESSVIFAKGSESCYCEDMVRVVADQKYKYSDGHYEMNIEVPFLSDACKGKAVEQVNKEIESFTAELAEDFYDDMEAAGKKGYGAVYSNYEVLTNTDNWFSIQLAVNGIKASSNNYYKIYNIDRTEDQVVQFSDLFRTKDAYKTIKNNILRQMKKRMKDQKELVYFTGKESDVWDFSEDQNFYFNQDGEMVVVFNQYEAAPGFMGTPKFTIEQDTLRRILKPQYLKITD